MKTFTKGKLTTVVDDDDFRILSYRANGWKESETVDKPKDETDMRIVNAIETATASESDCKNSKGKSKKKGQGALGKKVNDSVDAAKIAAIESEIVDDGLIAPSVSTETENENNG